MSLLQERFPIATGLGPCPEPSSLRHEWLSARGELLLQAWHWASLRDACQKCEESRNVAGFFQRWALDEIIAEQARTNLRQIERVLRHMSHNPYGTCRECRQEIPSSQLQLEPVALLCAACIEGRLDYLAADAL